MRPLTLHYGNIPNFESIATMVKLEGIKISYALPGRVKFRIADLEGEHVLAERLQDEVSRIDGIKEIEVDPEKGSVFIKYDKKQVSRPESAHALLSALKNALPKRDLSALEHWLGVKD